jgi:cobalt-zinc-cadmium efflux system outer membrane protein
MLRIHKLLWPMLAVVAACQVRAAPPSEPLPAVLTRDAVVRYALEHNPQLAVVRQARNQASAGVVLARIFPYNPTYQSIELGVNGPAAAGVTNHVFTEHYVVQQIELFGQWKLRKAAAAATVTRTDWEIAAQEVATAIAAVRLYNIILYRQQKHQILEETVRLNEQIVDQGKRLVEAGRLRPAEVIVARTELDTARAARGQGRTALAVARADLRRLLGTLDDGFETTGTLDPPLPILDKESLIPYALQLRPEVHARTAAITEAEARLNLQVADRYGNPAVGPRVEFNETQAMFVGVVLTGPIPVWNRRQGEIAQRKADLARAQADLRSVETDVSTAVSAALARLGEARKWADDYTNEVLPNLENARKDLDRLFAQNEPGVDVIRVIGVQRNFLRATDAYIDAKFEVSQARCDLAAAVGDPVLAAGPPETNPPTLPAPAKAPGP